MTIERKEQTGSDPTTLHLFHFTDENYRAVTPRYNMAETAKGELTSVLGVMVKTGREMVSKGKRGIEHSQLVMDQVFSLRESATSGAAYLTIVDELTQQNVPPEDIMDFYLRCLKINTYISEKQSNETVERVAAQRIIKNSAADREFLNLMEKEGRNIPDWFKGNKDAWKGFVSKHALFSTYLQNFPQNYPFIFNSDSNFILGYTAKDSLPEWLEEWFEEGKIPERSTVIEEVIQDKKESETLFKQVEQIRRQTDYIGGLYAKKNVKSMIWSEKRRRQVSSMPQNFTNCILQIGALRDYPELPIDLNSDPNMETMREINRTMIPSNIAHERRIKAFVESQEGGIGKESLALWLESNLRKAGIIKSAQQTINPISGQRLTALFDESMQSEITTEFQHLKLTDKKAFNALHFDIMPLLQILRGEEIAYLQELVEISQGESMEPIIWEMAEVISIRLREGIGSVELPKLTAITLSHVEQFFGSWLRANWQWANQQLYENLLEKYNKSTAVTTDVETPQEIDDSETQAIFSVELQEIEEEIKQSERGNLAGWQIYYTVDRRITPDSLIEIEGETLEEKGEFLKQFVRKRKIPCTMDEENIILSLDKMIVAPPGEEWVRMRMNVDGVEYKKLKYKGPMRTLYQRNDERKEIIFFIHKKKDWGYRFN